MISHLLVAALATLCFAILFQAPPRHWLLCGGIGTVSWLANLILLRLGTPYAFACFGATLILVTVARLASVICKTPSTVFLIPGIFPLVPGAGIYYTAFHLFTGNLALASAYGMETVTTSGAISLGILFGSTVPQGLYVKLGSLFGPKKGEA